ncbi:MAG: PAS domain-containing protein [Elusimicrobia bacterium]|nr:PAS domain-containing protein [Elusimicrobiota bacterium]
MELSCVGPRIPASEGVDHRALIENIQLGISLIGADFRIMTANAAQGAFFRKAPQGFVGRLCYEAYEKRRSICLHCPGVRAMMTRQAQEAYTEFVRDDGARVPVHVRAFPMLSAEGRVTGFIELVEDITGRNRTEDDLRFTNALLRAQQEVSPDGILVVDEQGRMVSFNNRFLEMWGIPPKVAESRSDERALRSVLAKLVDPEGFMAGVRRLYRRRKLRTRSEIALKDGRVFDRYSAPMLGPEGDYYGRVWFFHDVSERKRVERERQALHARIVSSQEDERRRLARDLHDGVGQLLAGIKFSLQSLTRPAPSGRPGRRKDILGVERLLDRAIAETRQVAQNLMPCELQDFGLKGVLRSLGRGLQDRSGIRMRLSFEGIPRRVPPDLALAVLRIAQEGLNNVETHSRATTASLSLGWGSGGVRLSVEDNGKGLAAGRGRPSARGMGLRNISDRVASLGGAMEFSSAPGKGTRLVVRIPSQAGGAGSGGPKTAAAGCPATGPANQVKGGC